MHSTDLGGAGEPNALNTRNSTTCTRALQSIHTPLRSTDCTAESTATKPADAATKPANTTQELSGPKETQNNTGSRTVEETQRITPKESRADRSAWTGFSIEELLRPISTQDTNSDATTTTTTTTTTETLSQQQNAVCNEDVSNKVPDVALTNEAVTNVAFASLVTSNNTGSVSSLATTEKDKDATDTLSDNAQRNHENVTGAPVDKTIDSSRNHSNKDNSTSEKGLTVAINAEVVSRNNSSEGNIPTSTGSAIKEGEKSKSSDSCNLEPKNTDSSKNGEIVSPETRETLSLFESVHSMLSNISGEPGTSYRTPKADACESADKVRQKEASQTCEGAESVDSAQRSSEETGQGKINETGEGLAPPTVIIPGMLQGQAGFLFFN